ncbi:MAG: transcriptional repressor [Coriobacteriia bacterium]|nr:transcriptional repressor [Coriobacteriia bacterium]MBN2840894.1 transcriptional repressor [Coriobacteriia bacterium]
MSSRRTIRSTEPMALYGRGRVSAQRAAIAKAAEAMSGAFVAEELHRAVTSVEPGIGLATVYRAISAMQSAGTLVTVGERDGCALLAICVRGDHHHHLVCTECGAVVGIDCPIDETTMRAAAREGHLVTSHQIVLYGLCARCRARTENT